MKHIKFYIDFNMCVRIQSILNFRGFVAQFQYLKLFKMNPIFGEIVF